MQDFCKNIKNLPESKINSLKLRRSEITGQLETECFLERMNEYMIVSYISACDISEWPLTNEAQPMGKWGRVSSVSLKNGWARDPNNTKNS